LLILLLIADSDHDFYVFREKDSNGVSVVYRRNAGGIGLIMEKEDGKKEDVVVA
jgi:hypothetical protein